MVNFVDALEDSGNGTMEESEKEAEEEREEERDDKLEEELEEEAVAGPQVANASLVDIKHSSRYDQFMKTT